jgi:hypothetical protein
VTRELNPHSVPRVRAIAELSLELLLTRGGELAKRWAVALILTRPLEDIGGLPLKEIAREGPLLCLQVLRAVQSDSELDRLTGEGPTTGREQSAPARRLSSLAGASDAVGTIEAVEALRGVLWEVLLEEVRFSGDPRSSSRQLADLSDRLAYVCTRAMAADLVAARSQAEVEDAGRTSSAAEGAARTVDAKAPLARARVVIVDERSEQQVPEPEPRAAGLEQRAAEEEPDRPLSWDESPPVPPGRGSEQIEIRDERGEEGPAAWIGSIGRQLTRYADDGVPFAVLLVEPAGLERMRNSQGPGELQLLGEQLEEAFEVVWPGSVTRQRLGRYWLIAPATNRLGVRELVARLREAVAPAVTYRGAPLQLAVGTAACPDDGQEASALAAHADVGLYADRATIARAPAPVDEHA